jgi:CubicO group peptidase (beta-lactamase class C family)
MLKEARSIQQDFVERVEPMLTKEQKKEWEAIRRRCGCGDGEEAGAVSSSAGHKNESGACPEFASRARRRPSDTTECYSTSTLSAASTTAPIPAAAEPMRKPLAGHTWPAGSARPPVLYSPSRRRTAEQSAHKGRIMSLEPGSFASKIIPFALIALLPLIAQAQTAKPEQAGLSQARLQRVGELVERNIKAGEVTGAVTLVARNGRIVFLQAQGESSLETKTPMQKDTIFRIASMTKPVTGVAILMLVEEGKVRLTDPISKFIPAFKDLKVSVTHPRAPALALPAPGAAPLPPQTFLVPAEREMTILDALTHTSGIMSGPPSIAAGRALEDSRQQTGSSGPRPRHRAARIPAGLALGIQRAGGVRHAGAHRGIVSGQNFNEFTQQRIFKPLGMRETFFWPTSAQRARLVGSYTKTAKGLTPRENPDQLSSEVYFSGSGGLMSTAESYARFGMMLANGGELDGVRILSPRSVELMGSAFIPDTLPGRSPGEGYGLSVRVVTDPVARITTLSKGSFGWSGAFGTHFFVDPTKKLVGILMIQTPANEMRGDFEDAVMQAVGE